MKELLKNWKIAQDAGANLPCPRCGAMKMKSPAVENALSRRADIYVCSSCGSEEAMEDYRYAHEDTHSDEYNERMLERWWLGSTVLGKPNIRIGRNGKLKISCERDIELSQQDIDDIMVSALEGGINYWCCSAEVVGDYLGEYASDQISRNGTLILHDSEEDEQYEFTLDKFLKGFILACKNGFASDWFDGSEVDTCQIDAEGADVIVQYGLFGELVYG